jgi:predicted nuclease of restriction endonuclease-like RecB superfamily
MGERVIRTKILRGTLLNPREGWNWKQGWGEFGGKRYFYRSLWEKNYGRYLEWLKTIGQIKDWEHETDTFWFEKIRRGVRCYTPDFKVFENNGKIAYHEVKGWMDSKSKTKIKRMRKYYPDVGLIVIDQKSYKKLSNKVSKIIPGWEVIMRKWNKKKGKEERSVVETCSVLCKKCGLNTEKKNICLGGRDRVLYVCRNGHGTFEEEIGK